MTSSFSNFRGWDTIPIPYYMYIPSAGAHVCKMAHCVSEFRDYVSERGPDTYPNFWRRFSSIRKAPSNHQMLITDVQIL